MCDAAWDDVVPAFTAQGGLRPYTPVELDAIGGAQAFSAASWQTHGVLGSDVVGALPRCMDVRAIAHRRDVLLKTGLSESQAFATLGGFEHTPQLINATSPDIAPLVHAGRNDWNVWQDAAMFMWAYGADILAPDGRTATFSAARAAKDAGGWADDAARANLAFAPFPAGPGGHNTFVGGSNLGILNNCPNPHAALQRCARSTLRSLQMKEPSIGEAEAPATQDFG